MKIIWKAFNPFDEFWRQEPFNLPRRWKISKMGNNSLTTTTTTHTQNGNIGKWDWGPSKSLLKWNGSDANGSDKKKTENWNKKCEMSSWVLSEFEMKQWRKYFVQNLRFLSFFLLRLLFQSASSSSSSLLSIFKWLKVFDSV